MVNKHITPEDIRTETVEDERRTIAKAISASVYLNQLSET